VFFVEIVLLNLWFSLCFSLRVEQHDLNEKHYTQRKPKVEQHDLNEKHRENQRLSNTISTKNTTHRENQRLSNVVFFVEIVLLNLWFSLCFSLRSCCSTFGFLCV
jgi:hypothetical protein